MLEDFVPGVSRVIGECIEVHIVHVGTTHGRAPKNARPRSANTQAPNQEDVHALHLTIAELRRENDQLKREVQHGS